MKKETKIKGIVYGSNLVVNPVINVVGAQSALGNPGNPFGAAVFGALDVISYFLPSLKTNKYVGVGKVIGGVYYSLSSVMNGINGNLLDLPFDASMAYQLIVDSMEIYKKRNLKSDFKEIGKKGKELGKKGKKAFDDASRKLDEYNQNKKDKNSLEMKL